MKVQSAPTNSLSEELTVWSLAQTRGNTSVATLEKHATPLNGGNPRTGVAPQAVDVANPKPQQAKKQSTGAVFGSTFLTIFLAEFGDKTQLSTLLMSAESQSPGVVFLGAGVALITTSLLGVLLGQWLAKRVAPKTLETAAGASLLLVSAMLLWDVVQF